MLLKDMAFFAFKSYQNEKEISIEAFLVLINPSANEITLRASITIIDYQFNRPFYNRKFRTFPAV